MKEIADGQSFKNIIRNQQIYVDKTQDIYNFLKIKSRLFLSRPRRFGKSLVFDTIATLFEKGVDPYFNDTWIYDKWKEKTYPVLRLNFLDFPTDDYDLFCEKFAREIQRFANRNGFDNYEEILKDPSSCITEILNAVLDKDAQIVILIDEYDAQLTSNINNEELYKTFQQSLRNLYGTLKGKEVIKFLGITGVTRLKDVSIFSVGSDIRDVTYQSSVSTITGFTREEIAKYYIDYLNLGVSLEQKKSVEEVTAQERDELIDRLAKEYNGYCFDKSNRKTVFSTFSVNLFFSDLYTEHEVIFGDYWYDNGGVPSILARYLKTHTIDILEYKQDKFNISYQQFVNPTSLLSIEQKVLMTQTGYLTLKSTLEITKPLIVGFPNNEVYRALITLSFYKFYGFEITISDESIKNLKHGTAEEVKGVIESIIHTVPYDHNPISSKTILRALIYMFFVGARITVIPEFPNDKGRSDLEIEFDERRIVIEFKYAKSVNDAKTKLMQAKNQIIENDYGNHGPFKDYMRFALVYNGKTKKIAYFEEVPKN